MKARASTHAAEITVFVPILTAKLREIAPVYLDLNLRSKAEVCGTAPLARPLDTWHKSR